MQLPHYGTATSRRRPKSTSASSPNKIVNTSKATNGYSKTCPEVSVASMQKTNDLSSLEVAAIGKPTANGPAKFISAPRLISISHTLITNGHRSPATSSFTSCKITQCSKTVAHEQVRRANISNFNLNTFVKAAPTPSVTSHLSETKAGVPTQSTGSPMPAEEATRVGFH